MIGLLQRVSKATIYLNNKKANSIKNGLVVFVGIEKKDSEHNAEILLKKILKCRIFNDEKNLMNLNLGGISGELMLVPQFTLMANFEKGNRPSFSHIASKDKSNFLFHYFSDLAKQRYPHVKIGFFGEDMAVELINEGPTTFWLQA